MVHSKNKGSTFERKIGQELFLRLGFAFKRNLEQSREADHGDLITDDVDFPFIIECKRYAKGNDIQKAWWEQASRAAKSANKYPCVVYKFDHKPIEVALPLVAIAEAFGTTANQFSGKWRTDLDGLAYIAREIISGRNL